MRYVWDAIQMMFLYIAGHSLADTALQKDDMGRGKSRHNPIDMSRVPVGQKPLHLWPMWITHHALIQGFIVSLITFLITFDITFSINIGMLECASHWVIDFFKCDNAYGPYEDQSLHILMKIFYIGLIFVRKI
jgi:hypothetical protein